MSNISFEAKNGSEQLDQFFRDNQIKVVVSEIKHLRADLMQLEAKRRGQLASLQFTCVQIKELKLKISVWAGRLDFD